jgi:hypothetical protein
VLRSVIFTGGNNLTSNSCSGVPGRLVLALARNSLVTRSSDFLSFVQSKTLSLKSLSIPSMKWTNELGEAVGSLQALECLTIVHSVDCPMELVLQQLQSYRRLRMLVITSMRPNYVLDAAVAHHVSSCVAGPLVSLELKGYVFRQQNWCHFYTQCKVARLWFVLLLLASSRGRQRATWRHGFANHASLRSASFAFVAAHSWHQY